MSTVILGREFVGSKPIMVFTHGYASSCAGYYPIFKRLMEDFVVICFDHVGMGVSSRHKDHYPKGLPVQSLNFFIDHMEKWRQKVQSKYSINMDKFYLVGHSLGGYIVGNYAVKYP